MFSLLNDGGSELKPSEVLLLAVRSIADASKKVFGEEVCKIGTRFSVMPAHAATPVAFIASPARATPSYPISEISGLTLVSLMKVLFTSCPYVSHVSPALQHPLPTLVMVAPIHRCCPRHTGMPHSAIAQGGEALRLWHAATLTQKASHLADCRTSPNCTPMLNHRLW